MGTKNQSNGKQIIQAVVGAIALLALSAYTFTHTGHVLAGYVNPAIVGYVAAFGVELSIIALALRLGELKKAGLRGGFMAFTLASVTCVSIACNLFAGFEVSQGRGLTLSTVNTLDPLQAMVGIISTGLLPLVVLALSEVLSGDVESVIKAAGKSTPSTVTAARIAQIEPAPVSSTAMIDAQVGTLAQARNVKSEQDAQAKNERLGKLLTLCAGNPDMGVTELASQLGVSRTAVYSYVKELVDTGRLSKNGQGWEVVSPDTLPVSTVDSVPVVN